MTEEGIKKDVLVLLYIVSAVLVILAAFVYTITSSKYSKVLFPPDESSRPVKQPVESTATHKITVTGYYWQTYFVIIEENGDITNVRTGGKLQFNDVPHVIEKITKTEM